MYTYKSIHPEIGYHQVCVHYKCYRLHYASYSNAISLSSSM